MSTCMMGLTGEPGVAAALAAAALAETGLTDDCVWLRLMGCARQHSIRHVASKLQEEARLRLDVVKEVGCRCL